MRFPSSCNPLQAQGIGARPRLQPLCRPFGTGGNPAHKSGALPTIRYPDADSVDTRARALEARAAARRSPTRPGEPADAAARLSPATLQAARAQYPPAGTQQQREQPPPHPRRRGKDRRRSSSRTHTARAQAANAEQHEPRPVPLARWLAGGGWRRLAVGTRVSQGGTPRLAGWLAGVGVGGSTPAIFHLG
jgi:hypothetical protein